VARRGAILPLAVLGAALLATPARAAEQQAYAAGLTYATPVVALAQGDSLRFNNLDAAAGHDLVSDVPSLFGSQVIQAGKSSPVQGVFKLKPGTYAFHCSLHSWMHGELQVTAGGGGGGPGLPPTPNPGTAPDGTDPATLLPRAPAEPLGSSTWPTYGHDLAGSRTGGNEAPSWNEVPNLGPVWSFLSHDGDFTGTPVVDRGTLVAASGGGTVFALNGATGRKRWSRDLNQPINGTAAISAGRVFVPVAKPGRPRIVAFSLRTGRILWSRTVDHQKNADVFGSPVAYHGRVYIGVSGEFGEVNDPNVNVRGAVVALDVRTGRPRWKTYMVPRRHDGGSVWSTPAIDKRTGLLYVGTGNAYHEPSASTTDSIVALDARRGRMRAHFQATAGDVWNATGNAAKGPDADFGSSPNLIVDPHGRALVGVGQKSGTYWAADRRTLKPAWSAVIGAGSQVGGIVGSTAYDGTHVYGPDTPGGEVWALSRSGLPAWSSSDGGPLHFSPVSAANGLVYSTDMSGHLTVRDAGTGVVLAKLPIGASSWGGVAVAGGSVFAVTGSQTGSGWIVSYRVRP
jgi:polyvinyl alcohol dehydrogenase (cytochrome)